MRRTNTNLAGIPVLLLIVVGSVVTFVQWAIEQATAHPYWALVVFVAFCALFVDSYRKAVALQRAAQGMQADVRLMSPLDYELYCAELLRRAGWKVRHNGGAGDQGADLIAERAGSRVVIQCKRYAGPVGNAAVQQASAGRAYHRAHIAVVVTPSSYTASAVALATSTSVILLHHERLADLAKIVRLPD